MKLWNIAEKLLALDLNKGFSQSTLSKCNLTYDSGGRLATIVDTLNSPNITYTLSYDGDDNLTQVTDGTNTWAITYTDGIITSINQT
jgi:uncharacterized protein RhaS with RHS repeats